MNLTPQSLRSPTSPYDQHSKQSFSTQRPCYPTTPQPEPTSMEQTNRGLGIFELPLPQHQQRQQSTVQELPPSPQPSDCWSHSSAMEQDFPQTSQPPDIFSAAFDPFSGYTNNPNTGMMTSTSPEAPALVFCQTPPSTTHRSSISSSYSPSMQTANHYNGKVKQEDSNEWYSSSGNDPIIRRSLTTQGLTPYSNGVSPIANVTEEYYHSQAGEWSKPSSAYPSEFSADGRSRFDAAPMLPSVNRIKKKRQRTTPEEATHECRVCGKLFKRSYNWKSHMETHNPDRKYPHPCKETVGNSPCTKKFQRKTDLDRHVDSVSICESLYRRAIFVNMPYRSISRRATTHATSVEIVSPAETLYEGTRRMAAPKDSSLASVREPLWHQHDGPLRISHGADLTTHTECPSRRHPPWLRQCPQLRRPASQRTAGPNLSAVPFRQPRSSHHNFLRRSGR